MRKIRSISRQELRELINAFNELLEELSNKGIIELEDKEIQKKESDTIGI